MPPKPHILLPVLIPRPALEQEDGDDLRNESQHLDLIPGPVAVFAAFIKAYKSLKLPVIRDGALQHAEDPLRSQDICCGFGNTERSGQ